MATRSNGLRRERREAERQRREERRGEHVTTRDGRNVDPAVGALAGEASVVHVRKPEDAFPLTDAAPVAAAGPGAARGTYYGLPAIKKPVWKAWIPTYFWTGGAAGAAATLGAAAQIVAPRALRRLVFRARSMATLGIGASAALLIIDLGRPSRFFNMLRVVRPTSPMNVGTWILTGSGISSALATLGSRRAGLVAGAFGLPLAGYTAVLLSNTAVPAWLHARRSLPALFVASGVTSAAALFELMPQTEREARVTKAFSLAGKIAEVAGMRAVQRALGRRAHVGESLRTGRAGVLWRAARLLSVAGLVATLLPPRRGRHLAAGLLSTAGALAMRFAVVEAGKQSARDPRATFEPQREAMGDVPRSALPERVVREPAVAGISGVP